MQYQESQSLKLKSSLSPLRSLLVFSLAPLSLVVLWVSSLPLYPPHKLTVYRHAAACTCSQCSLVVECFLTLAHSS